MITPSSPDSAESNSNAEPYQGEAMPEIIVDAAQLSPDAFKAGLERIAGTKADNMYCVFSKDKTKHFRMPHNPDQPWVTKLRKQAEHVAKEVGGIVLTVSEAIPLMFQQIVEDAKRKHGG